MIPRDYQIEAHERSFAELEAVQRTLLVYPTGAGKGFIIALLILQALRRQKQPVLLTVHKIDLVKQLFEELTELLPDVSIAVEQGENTDLTDGQAFDVAICSIQTLQKRPQAVAGIPFELILTDETHRALAEGYLELYENLGCFHEQGPKLIGLTATAYRGDGQSLAKVFQSVAVRKDIIWGIKEAWLCPLRAKSVKIELADGDDREILREEMQKRFMETFLKELAVSDGSPGGYSAKYPTLVMVPSVPEGRELERLLRSRGINARMVDSKMDQELRWQYMRDFKEQRLEVLLGFNLFVEGYNAPRAAVLCMLRNTESPTTFMQAIGRILRPYISDQALFKTYNASTDPEERHSMIETSDKPFAMLYDFTPVSSKYKPMTIGRLHGLHPEFDFEGEDIVEKLDEIDELRETCPVISSDNLRSAREIGIVLEDMNFFQEAITPNLGVPPNAGLTYAKQGDLWRLHFTEQKYSKAAKQEESITWVIKITQDARGEWQAFVEQPEQYRVWYWNGKRYTRRGLRRKETAKPNEKIKIRGKTLPKYEKIAGMAPRFLCSAETKSQIFYLAENWVYQFFPKAYRLAQKDNPWRTDDPSPGQRKLLKKMLKDGIPLPETINKGTASLMIDLWTTGALNSINPKRRLGARKRRQAYA